MYKFVNPKQLLSENAYITYYIYIYARVCVCVCAIRVSDISVFFRR